MGDYNATTSPQTEDREQMLLRKIARLLYGAMTGDAPLATSGGGALTVTARNPASLPTYTPGDSVSLQTDAHGNLLVNPANSTRADDFVSADPKQYTTVSTATPITADGPVFTLAAGEKGIIQNLDDAAVYVKLGASASSSSFNFVLPASTSANDGTSPPYQIDDYIGVVSIAAATGSPRVSAYKLS